jgi:hypothetical protein
MRLFASGPEPLYLSKTATAFSQLFEFLNLVNGTILSLYRSYINKGETQHLKFI